MFTQLENGAGLDMVRWLQSMRSPLLDMLAQGLDFLGGDAAFVLIVLLFYWSVNRHLGRRSLVVLIFVEVLVTVLKMISQTPRPFVVAPDMIQRLVEVGIGSNGMPSSGIPSGHMAISLALLGYAVLWLKIRRGWWYLGIYVALMAWSRMYAGAHYPQDVIIGTFAGLVIVWFSHRYMDTFARLWGSQRWQVKLALVVIAAPVVAFGFFTNSEEQQMILGLMLGGGLSLLLEERYLMFDAGSGSLINRLIRFVVGLALAGATYYGLKMVIDIEPQMIFRTVRYAVVGAMVMGIYPWLCVRAGFMGREVETPPVPERREASAGAD